MCSYNHVSIKGVCLCVCVCVCAYFTNKHSTSLSRMHIAHLLTGRGWCCQREVPSRGVGVVVSMSGGSAVQGSGGAVGVGGP